MLKNSQREINRYLELLKVRPGDAYYKHSLEKAYEEKHQIQQRLRLLRSAISKQISPSEYAERFQILDNQDPQTRNRLYNTRLQKIKVLKNKLKQKITDFDTKSDKYLAGQAYTDD